MKQKQMTDSCRLFERSFKSGAEYHGHDQAKKDAAAAKHAATALKNAASNYRFSDLLEPEQLLAIKAAANVMTNLAEVLDEVCVLAKRHFAKCEADRRLKDAQRKAEREAELDAIAGARWGDDQSMKSEALDLKEFFTRSECGDWLAQRRRIVGTGSVVIGPDIDVGGGRSEFSEVGRLVTVVDGAADLLRLRRFVAATIDALAREKRASYFHSSGTWRHWHYPTLIEFEAWRVERADRKRVVALLTGSV